MPAISSKSVSYTHLVIKLAKAAIVDWKAVLIFLAVFGGAVFTPVSPMIYIVAAGVAGILLKAWEVKAK